MKKALVDSGPLIALFDRDDRYHATVLSFLKQWKGDLLSTWPVLTEVSHLLDFSAKAQMDFLTWVDRGGLTLFSLDSSHIAPIITVMDRYRDRPMDLADASLLVLANELRIHSIVTLDSDFLIDRLHGKKAFTNLLADSLHPHL